MRKRFMTGLMLCGVWVTGCNGETGTEASVASTRQRVASPELEASLSCIETYAKAGTCDWDHWSELWEKCQTYEHPALEDGSFLDAVQSGTCTAANWPTLRAQLVTRRPPPVRLREDCYGDSEVLLEAASNGCYALAQAAGASFVDVPLGKTVTLHAVAGCTGDSVTVETDTNLCETSFESGASANDTVRSFRLQDVEAPPSPYRYDCAAAESTCVQNYNSQSTLGAINQQHTIKLVRVTVAGRTTPSLSSIQANADKLNTYLATSSRNQVGLQRVGSQIVQATGTHCDTVKADAVRKAQSNAFMTVYVMPTGLCPSSRAGTRAIYLNDNLFRSYAHETGHILGLAHGNGRDGTTGKPVEYGDSSTYMGRYPSDNYNLPQLHWLGWTKKEELVRVNPALDTVGFTEVRLRPVDENVDSISGDRLGAVYDIPGSDDRLFIAVPKSRLNDSNQIEGGTVFVYRAPKCAGCVGMVMGTLVAARFVARNTNVHTVGDLRVRPVAFESHLVRVSGKDVEVFDSVTVRFER
ncbi:hypothetical protein LZ198_00220 [Myxococcus sp. K15C18031901]|uniref:hypothetical protein n=1 Tax=Myxococcus dinghuensis TaxID=2906761 RepID=UPI0020A767E6|nr:hypothetical protein [Myxococcus dinghuensis]MCP3097288.1 hypothetical protein [Myxococcus dinghuensis]